MVVATRKPKGSIRPACLLELQGAKRRVVANAPASGLTNLLGRPASYYILWKSQVLILCQNVF